MSEHKESEEAKLESDAILFDPLLYIQRYRLISDLLKEVTDIRKIVDFGCDSGNFFKYIKGIPTLQEISLVDVDANSLHQAEYKCKPLACDFIFRRSVELNVHLYEGSVLVQDSRLEDYDAVTCIEVVEHFEPHFLDGMVSNIFGHIKPKIAIFSTPNREFNKVFKKKDDSFRHWDHKFEWTRVEFGNWCESVITHYSNYSVEYTGVGNPTEGLEEVGFCTQIAIFKAKRELPRSSDVMKEMPYKKVFSTLHPGPRSSDE